MFNISLHFYFAAGKKIFRDFLRCEYSEENILFWMAVEELKKESNPDVIEEKARFIYEDYISILSPKEVSAVQYNILFYYQLFKNMLLLQQRYFINYGICTITIHVS